MHPNAAFRSDDDPLAFVGHQGFAHIFGTTPEGPRVGEDWTMAKMARPKAEAMMRAITGFELTPTAIRTTLKASQNRSEADAAGVIAALERLGEHAGAATIRATRKAS